MPGLDRIIAKSLSDIIEKNLGIKTVQKIENRLFEKYGISWSQSLEEFEKLDFVLKELFGDVGAKGLENKFCENIFDSKSKKTDEGWIIISDPRINSIIIQIFGDLEKKKIIDSVISTPKIMYEIIKECDLPQTSGYRKINALINDGFLIPTEFEVKENKKIFKYICTFKNLKIDINSNQIKVSVQLNDSQQQCSFLRTINA
ncbi:MAG: hypothetical protein AABX09_03010 [Thermoproteota archaeon]